MPVSRLEAFKAGKSLALFDMWQRFVDAHKRWLIPTHHEVPA